MDTTYAESTIKKAPTRPAGNQLGDPVADQPKDDESMTLFEALAYLDSEILYSMDDGGGWSEECGWGGEEGFADDWQWG